VNNPLILIAWIISKRRQFCEFPKVEFFCWIINNDSNNLLTKLFWFPHALRKACHEICNYLTYARPSIQSYIHYKVLTEKGENLRKHPARADIAGSQSILSNKKKIKVNSLVCFTHTGTRGLESAKSCIAPRRRRTTTRTHMQRRRFESSTLGRRRGTPVFCP
jgi:hypothetical protein